MIMYKTLKKLLRGTTKRDDRGNDSTPQKIDLRDRVVVIGDSHVRSYARNPNFFPIFIGQGMLHNYTTDDFVANVREKVTRVLESVTCHKVLIIAGEPDSRHSLGLGWIPWKQLLEEPETKSNNSTETASLLEQSSRRISNFVEELSSLWKQTEFMVASIHPVEMDMQNSSIDKLNEMLNLSLGEKFIDARGYKNQLRRCLIDEVHHSGEIQKYIEEILVDRGFLKNRKSVEKTENWDREEIRKIFVKNDRFGCYIPEQ